MAKSLNARLNKLKAKAEENVAVTVKSGKTIVATPKKGIHLDTVIKNDVNLDDKPTSARKRVGTSLGCTLNMDNFESIRIDCWLADDVQEGETVEQAFNRIVEIVQRQVEDVANTHK